MGNISAALALAGFFLVLTVIGSLTFGDGEAAKAIGRTMFMQSESKVTAADEPNATKSRKALLLRRRAFEMRSELRWMLQDFTNAERELWEAQIKLLEDMANLAEARANQMDGRVIAILRNAVEISQKRVDHRESRVDRR